MKSRDEIVIIMLQWLHLYTLGSRGSRELKTFLETRLISSRVDKKLKNKEREIHAFKEGIRPKIVAIASGRGHCLQASWERFFGARMSLQFRTRLTSISLQHEPRSWHNRATIGPRSGHDQATIGPRSSHD